MFSRNTQGDQSYSATVTNTDDPDRRGRLKVTCSALLGDESREFPGWVDPELPWGWFLIPNVGQQVTLTIAGGSSSDIYSGQSTIASGKLRWSASIYTNADAEDANPVGDEFKVNYGQRRGFKTPRGHVFLFDDTKGKEQITMSWSGGTPTQPKSALMSMDSSGSFIVQDAGGSVFYMNSTDGETSLINQGGGYMILNGDGISLVDPNNNALIMNSDGISLVSNSPINFAGSDHVFSNGLHFLDNGQNVNVGGIASSFHPATAAGIAMLAITNANVAIPGDPTWLEQYNALIVTALL